MYLNRLFFGFIAFIILIILVLLLFVGGGKKPTTPAIELQPLPSYAATGGIVSLQTNGIVNGDELHRAIRITVSADSRELDVIQGYSGSVISTQTFYNTTDAYTAFLTAINNYGFTLKNTKSKAPASAVGQCALGFTYVMKLDQNGNELSNTWASTCGKAVGNSTANTPTLLTLFQNQIPNYGTLTQNVNLSATTTQ